MALSLFQGIDLRGIQSCNICAKLLLIKFQCIHKVSQHFKLFTQDFIKIYFMNNSLQKKLRAAVCARNLPNKQNSAHNPVKGYIAEYFELRVYI